MKKIIVTFLFAAILLTGCGKSNSNSNKPDTDSDSTTGDISTFSCITIKDSDLDTAYDDSSYCIDYSDDQVSSTATNVTISGTSVTITEEGTYVIAGNCSDGQIIIDAKEDDKVHLIFNGINLTSEKSAPLYIKNADKVILTLSENTDNYLSDGSEYVYDDIESEDPNSTIFSKDDLSINGNGTLTINASLNNGISCSDDLKIVGGVINVTAKNTAIRGKKSLTIQDATILVSSEDHALKSNSDKENKGYIHIISGNINITSGNDGIHANSHIIIDDGDITISADDDGMHADSNLLINNGNINITKSYEGLEGNVITINDGNIHITSSDDGLNAAGDVSSDDPMSSDDTCFIYINGGCLYVNADGDGIDSNGAIIMEGGIVAVDGPTSGGDSALDCGSTITINGGYLFAAGTSQMAEGASSSSKQNNALICLDSNISGLITVTDSDGNVILSFNASKSYNAINISSPELTADTVYNIYNGGTISNSTKLSDIFSKGGTLSDGTLITNYTQSEGAYSNGRGGFGGEGFGGNMKPDDNFDPDNKPDNMPDGNFVPDNKPDNMPDGNFDPDSKPDDMPDGGFEPGSRPDNMPDSNFEPGNKPDDIPKA